ncbi:MAG: hypothetical protein ACRD0P_11555 [Stackebrandtia sp.]
MTAISTAGTLIGVLIGAAFLFAGGVLLPLWQITEDHKPKK